MMKAIRGGVCVLLENESDVMKYKNAGFVIIEDNPAPIKKAEPVIADKTESANKATHSKNGKKKKGE